MYAQTLFEADVSIEQTRLPPGCLTKATLRRQTIAFRGTGGISEENGSCGFAPAFLDTETGAVYRARFADGRPAPMHLLEGLPPSVVMRRDEAGKVSATKPSLVAGFVRCGRFYTREQAAAALN
jgi:hypothetical protein